MEKMEIGGGTGMWARTLMTRLGVPCESSTSGLNVGVDT
jgi:hypothetical protein